MPTQCTAGTGIPPPFPSILFLSSHNNHTSRSLDYPCLQHPSRKEDTLVFLPQSHLAVSPGSTQALLSGQHPCLGKYRPLMPFWICWPIYCLKSLDPKFLVDGDLWFTFLWLHLRPRKTEVAESERCHSGQKPEVQE